MFKSMAEVKQANKNSDRYWFHRDTMRFFKSIVYDRIYAGKYFITSEKGPNGIRGYTVRCANEYGSIKKFQNFKNSVRRKVLKIILRN